MRRTMVHVGHEGLDRFGPPSRSKPYIICASMYSDCLDRDPLYPSFCSLRGGGVDFTWKIKPVRLFMTRTLSLLALFTRCDSISIF
jgi:hypothetical protein